ncbi:tapasin-related protein-like [Pelodytes ibericus]
MADHTAVCLDADKFQSTENTALSGSSKIPCLFQKTFQTDNLLADNTIKVTKDIIWLELRNKIGSDEERFDSDGVRFIFEDSSLKLMQFFKGDADMLVCEIKSYYTDNIQILWPGTSVNAMSLWFVATVKHKELHYQMKTFFYHVPATASVEDNVSLLDLSKTVGAHQASAAFTLTIRTPVIRSKLKQDVILDCAFSVDHQAIVKVTWSLQRKGREDLKLLSYAGPTKPIQYYSKNVVMQTEEVQKGNASILLRNVAVQSQGFYICSVSVASLFGDQKIHFEILESPVVDVNVEFLSLEEGQKKKLVCTASSYYPLDVNIEWLREYKDRRLLPKIVQNIVFSTHKNNNNGTYTLSSYFIFQASLQDNGAVFTCRVEHTSLRLPVKKSVAITVRESTRWGFELWLVGLELIL